HGRDVFAKAAANIDLGNFNDVGEKIIEVEKLEFYQNQRQGIVVRIDRFGNIVTNLPKQDKDTYSLQIAGNKYVMNYCPNYSSAKDDKLFLIEGSCNTLEISLKNGNAGDKLNVKIGEKITIS
ncbi:MAG: SAM hydroxide adenosyltransferase, partial [Planctomycetota bacterium]